MQVFVSWSGDRSRQLAVAVRDWLPEVMQNLDPWMSSEDIAKGQRWLNEVADLLERNSQGLLCVTPENVSEPWLNFEAGALAKSVKSSRVHPLLLGLSPEDLAGPLSQFQATNIADRDDAFSLITALNSGLDDPIDQPRLERAFNRTWQEFADTVKRIAPDDDAPATERTPDDMIAEVLLIVRRLEQTQTGTLPRGGELPLGFTPAMARRFADDLKRAADVAWSTEDGPRATEDVLAPGTVVRHRKFGRGTVVEVKANGAASEATVDFEESGRKHLVLGYAPLSVEPE